MPRLDQNRKDGIGANEGRHFMVGTGNVQWQILARNGYIIRYDGNDPHAIVKAQGIDQAVSAIISHGYDLPAGVEFYCTNKIGAQNRMFGRDAQWTNICRIVLGPKAATGGLVPSLASRQPMGAARVKCTCIHEIGHKLHELSIGEEEFYGEESVLDGHAATAAHVTSYAGQNKKEFIAEVFAAMILGVNLTPEVMREYTNLRGPLPNDF